MEIPYRYFCRKGAWKKTPFRAATTYQARDYIPSALRELKEELGLTIEPKQLIDCGLHRHHADEVFHGERFLDNQISKVFLLWLDVDEADITVQKEEIDSVKWFDYAECKQDVINGTIPNCIDVAELEMLEPHFVE